MIGYAHV